MQFMAPLFKKMWFITLFKTIRFFSSTDLYDYGWNWKLRMKKFLLEVGFFRGSNLKPFITLVHSFWGLCSRLSSLSVPKSWQEIRFSRNFSFPNNFQRELVTFLQIRLQLLKFYCCWNSISFSVSLFGKFLQAHNLPTFLKSSSVPNFFYKYPIMKCWP